MAERSLDDVQDACVFKLIKGNNKPLEEPVMFVFAQSIGHEPLLEQGFYFPLSAIPAGEEARKIFQDSLQERVQSDIENIRDKRLASGIYGVMVFPDETNYPAHSRGLSNDHLAHEGQTVPEIATDLAKGMIEMGMDVPKNCPSAREFKAHMQKPQSSSRNTMTV